MSNERLSHSLEVRENKILRAGIEREKEYGLYLPDWESVVQAGNMIAAQPFREPPLFTVEGIASHLEAAKKHLDSGLKKEFPNSNTVGVWEINVGKRPGNQTPSYELNLGIEGLTSRSKVSDTGIEYTKPYLLTVYSETLKSISEGKVADALGIERAALPRVVRAQLANVGDRAHVNCDDLASRLNKALGNTDREELISATEMADVLGTEKRDKYLLGQYDGLEVKMQLYNADHRPARIYNKVAKTQKNILEFIMNKDLQDPHLGIQVTIGERRLTAHSYGESHLISPEKRGAAQALAEKVRDIFLV